VRGLLFSTSHILLGRGRFLHCFTKSLKSRIKKRLISSANNNGRLCNTGNTVMVGYSYCVQNIFSAGQKLVLSIWECFSCSEIYFTTVSVAEKITNLQ